jgi:hypothetical protein
VIRAGRVALVLGVVLGVGGMALAGGGASSAWRALALPVALGAVVAGILELLALARDEWRRERPSSRRYVAVTCLFVAAFVLTVAATA